MSLQSDPPAPASPPSNLQYETLQRELGPDDPMAQGDYVKVEREGREPDGILIPSSGFGKPASVAGKPVYRSVTRVWREPYPPASSGGPKTELPHTPIDPLPANSMGASAGCDCIGCRIMRDMGSPSTDDVPPPDHVRTGDGNSPAPSTPGLSVLLAAAEGHKGCFHVVHAEGPMFCGVFEGAHAMITRGDHRFVSLADLLRLVAELARKPMFDQWNDAEERARVFARSNFDLRAELAGVTQQRDSLQEDVLSLRGGLNDSRQRLAVANARAEKADRERDDAVNSAKFYSHQWGAVASSRDDLRRQLAEAEETIATQHRLMANAEQRGAEKGRAESIPAESYRLHEAATCDQRPSAQAVRDDMAGNPVPSTGFVCCPRCGEKAEYLDLHQDPERFWCNKCVLPVYPDSRSTPDGFPGEQPAAFGILPRIAAFEEAGLILSELPPAEARLVISALATVFSV